MGLLPFTTGRALLHQRGRLEEATDILNSLLHGDVSLMNDIDSQDRPLFAVTDSVTKLPFQALSDGYRAFITWVWDLLFQLSRLDSIDGSRLTLIEIPGVVLVDEIDLLLHPEWQRVVVEQLSKTFPLLQFLFSSHSPLVAGTLELQQYICAGNRFRRLGDR